MATAAGLTAPEYDAFAPYYDAFTADSDYETWTEVILGVARAHGLRGLSLLDLACGTGKSFMPLLQRGFAVTGCDSSAGMLAVAARRAPQARLVRADLRDLPALGRFDLVACFDDSLNYLADEEELASAFAGMRDQLAAGGLALFDLNTLLTYRTTFATQSVAERDGIVFAWRGASPREAAPGCVAEARIDVFDPLEGGLYERVTTRHLQRHFPRDRVIALLAASGLECLAIHGVRDDCTLAPVPDESAHVKVLYTARRVKGGDAS